MSLTRPFELARATLGVPAGADRAAIKRAYRAALAEHPPDRDPDGFRQVREAYELLVDPAERARELLLAPRPAVAPPALPPPPEPPMPGSTAIALLRVIATRADAAVMLARADASEGAAPRPRASASRPRRKPDAPAPTDAKPSTGGT